MPPGNAVRIRRGADKTRPAPAGSHEWLPYSKMGKYLRNFRFCCKGGIHASHANLQKTVGWVKRGRKNHGLPKKEAYTDTRV